MSATQTLPDVEPDVTEADGKAHYVRIKALLLGGAVVALCGKKYVPTVIAEAGEREICQQCADLFEIIKMMDDS